MVRVDEVVTQVHFNQVDAALLKRHCPALLSMFTVCDDLGTEGRLLYSLDGCNASAAASDGGPVYMGCDFIALEDRFFYAKVYQESERCSGYHSMVIIGVRIEGASRRFIQNWWRRHQFVEISKEYLETQLFEHPSVYVVESASDSVPARSAQPAWRYAESSYLDVPETELLST